jgi:endogenous inhibitor of DNA gyrase (YacG/DUF329 family)
VARARRCPVCRKPVPPPPANRSWPFCSDRCRLVDLGKWLGEEYRVEGPRAGDGAERPGETREEGQEP